MKLVIAALSALAIGTSGAIAADLVATEAPVVTSVSDWTGFYVGVHAGYGAGKTVDSLDCGGDELLGSISWVTGQGYACESYTVAYTALENYDDALWETYDDLSDLKGWLAGAQAGYRQQFGNVVVGGEVSGSVTSISDTGLTYIEGNGFEGIYSGSIAANWLVLGTASIGYAIGDNLLISAVGGVALGELEFQSSAGYSDSKVAQGYTLGIQGDVKLSDNVTAFAAYNYVYFGDVQYEGTSAAGYISNLHEYDTSLNLLKVGVNYAFK